jgi:hypothetical protein
MVTRATGVRERLPEAKREGAHREIRTDTGTVHRVAGDTATVLGLTDPKLEALEARGQWLMRLRELLYGPGRPSDEEVLAVMHEWQLQRFRVLESRALYLETKLGEQKCKRP